MEKDMGWSKHHAMGLIHYDPQHCYPGYTLFTNNSGGFHAYLIDMQGRICHRWHAEEGISYAYLLPNGHLLLRTHPPRDGGVANRLPASAGALLELDWESNIVWEYRNPMMHHDFERLSNGHTLVLTWELLSPEVTSQVRGGFHTEHDPEQMFGDLIQEVSPDGDVVHEWHSWQHLSFAEDVICPLEPRHEWTHCNAVNITPDGDLLVSFRQISTVGLVNRTSGKFRWKWGPGEISHQHYPTWLGNGRVLLFDNGSHRLGQGVPYSRVIEVDIKTNEIVWAYCGDPPFSFYSPVISSAERLPNGNTLICEGSAGRLFEVTHESEVVWEYISPFFTQGARAAGGGALDSSNTVFRAHRYRLDHPALRSRNLDPGRYASL